MARRFSKKLIPSRKPGYFEARGRRVATEATEELLRVDQVAKLLRNRRVRPLVVFAQTVWPFAIIFVILYLVTGLLFYQFERGLYSLPNSFFFVIVAFGTNSFGYPVPTTPEAKILAAAITASEVFVLALLISALASRTGEIARRNSLGLLGTDMQQHHVVLGYGGVGRRVVQDLLVRGQHVAVVTERSEDVQIVRALTSSESLFVTYGPLAEPEVLKRVNVMTARSVIVAIDDDSTAIIAALNVRILAPNTRIVVSVARSELRETMQTAGVTFVASPSEMAGRLCASAAFEPDVAAVIDELTTASVGSDVREYVLTSATPISSQTFTEAAHKTRDRMDAVLIGYSRKEGDGRFHTHLAPPGTTTLAPGDAIILIIPEGNLQRFEEWFGVRQGR